MAQSIGALPSLSIIVLPTGSHLPRQAPSSIVAQDYPRLQIVCFGTAAEGLEAPPGSCCRPDLLVLPRPDDRGTGDLLESAVRACSGELIGWLREGDCCWRDSLWTVGRAASAHPGFALYIGNGLWHDVTTGRLVPFNRRHLALNRRALRAGADYVLQPATFIRRSAWQEVGGLDTALRYALDWDLLRRIADRHPAVLINEFLAVRRKPTDDRPREETLRRALEIARLVDAPPGKGLSAPHCHDLLTGIVDAARSTPLNSVAERMSPVLEAVYAPRAQQVGHADGFPIDGDPQDVTYLPFASLAQPPRRPDSPLDDTWPSFSIITPSFDQGRFLPQTLDSILGQQYPRLESIVMDGGSSDNTREVLERYGDRLAFWVSQPDRGPADAINQGLARAGGEVVSWLASDDVLAIGAVWEAARLFRDDPDLDMVYANALYIDENNRLLLADHGHQRTGLYHGEMQPVERVPAYWTYVHAIPQPTVFFRRRLLEKCGMLDESYKFIFDFELFWRFAQKAKIAKLERTQAFYRIHTTSKTSDWSKFLVELYRFSRPLWPGRSSRAFRSWLTGYVGSYMRRCHGSGPRNWRYWARAGLVAGSVFLKIGNPELRAQRRKAAQQPQGPPQPQPDLGLPALPEQFARANYHIGPPGTTYRSIFCSLIWPRHPGHSGGEIRDFHLLRRLLALSRVTFYSLRGDFAAGQEDVLAPHLEALHTPQSIGAAQPHLLDQGVYSISLPKRLASWLQKEGWPILGARYHADARNFLLCMQCHLRASLQQDMDRSAPDFLFVSPQVNPMALLLERLHPNTRLIMASYDVEAVRLRRLAESRKGWIGRLAGRLEADRAHRFEQENLACYDGIIAVSELDKQLFVSTYGYPAERILVVPNGVDPDYFCYLDRPGEGAKAVMFTGSLGYSPNDQAALRLIDRIIPQVRRSHPEASVWIVGQNPSAQVRSRHDGEQTVVTGKVPDVRPYLAGAAAACVPLLAGSGTKYKVLEALSSGLPVVCSPLAAEGLDLGHGDHLLIGESDEELAAALIRLLDDREGAARLAQAGRRQVERLYSWDQNLAALDGWLAMLAGLPRRRESGPTAMGAGGKKTEGRLAA